MNVFGKQLEWDDYVFMNKPWWKDIQETDIEDPIIHEWKYKFPWTKMTIQEEVLTDIGDKELKDKEIEVSGFVGILEDGDHKHKNGFVLFRRGRAVEGIGDRYFPRAISGTQSRAHRYIRLFGEIHFRNTKISFDKSKLNIDKDTRDQIFTAIAHNLKLVEFNGQKYNLISQAEKHRPNFVRKTAQTAVKNYQNSSKKKKTKIPKARLDEIVEKVYDKTYEDQIKKPYRKK